MAREARPVLIVVVPCYNEEAVLPETANRLREVLNKLISADEIARESGVLFVDDGSADSTWRVIGKLHDGNPSFFTGISFAANRGHQYAVMAGLMEARSRCDAAVSIDADLQDDAEAIAEMIRAYRGGAEIVYGVRRRRDTDTAFKRFTAEGFYKLMRRMGVRTIYNHADYRLLGAEALDALAEYSETDLFLRGLVPMLGYRTAEVQYDRTARFAGESKYPLKAMIRLAVAGITSCSDAPIKMIGAAGASVTGLGVLWGAFALIAALFGHGPGPVSAIIIVMLIMSGTILLALGILGAYIGKTYIQAKRRPLYRVAERLPPPGEVQP